MRFKIGIISLLLCLFVSKLKAGYDFYSDTTSFHMTIIGGTNAYHADVGKLNKIPVAKPTVVNIRSKLQLIKFKKACQTIFRVDKMATTHQMLNRFKQAGRYYRQARSIYKQWQKDSLFSERYMKEKEISATEKRLFYYAISQSLSGYGVHQHQLGNLTLSELYHGLALQLRSTYLKGTLAEVASLNNLAMVYKDQGKLFDAEKLLNEAQQLISKLGLEESRYQAVLFNNKAMLDFMLGHDEVSLDHIEKAEEIARRSFLKDAIDFQHIELNRLLLTKMSPEVADEKFETILHSFGKKLGKFHSVYANILNHAALHAIENGHYEKAIKRLDEAAYVNKRIYRLDHIHYAESIKKLAHLYQEVALFDRSRQLYELVLEIQQQELGRSSLDYYDTKLNYAVVCWRLNDHEEAKSNFLEVNRFYLQYINEVFPYLATHEKEKQWNRLSPNFTAFYRFVTANCDKYPELLKNMYNIRVATKGLLLHSTRKVKDQILQSKDQRLIDRYNTWSLNKQKYVRYLSMSNEELAEEGIVIDTFRKDLLNEEREIFRGIDNLTIISDSLGFDHVQQALAEDEAQVDIIHLPKADDANSFQYFALIVTKQNEAPQLVCIGDASYLEGKAFTYYKNTVHYQVNDYKSYRNYWKPVHDQIPNIKKVYFTPDGVYYKLNILTLNDPETKSYMIDHSEIITLTSPLDIVHQSQITKVDVGKGGVTLFGFPHYGDKGTIVPLPGTKQEVDAIYQLLQSRSMSIAEYIEDDASENQVRSLKNPGVLHIATHGFFIESSQEEATNKYSEQLQRKTTNPMLNSGLLLAGAENHMKGNQFDQAENNGILTAYEASSMQLTNTDIVVLSACETGGGEVKNGEGVYGLQRAFHEAGAKNLIISLWKVDDEATQLLMTSFYKHWMISNNQREAFYAAEKELKKRYSAPYYWGAFLFIGI